MPKKQDGTPDTGYMDEKKRNVTTIRLRKEPSDGLYLPIGCFDYLHMSGSFKEGDVIDTVNGHEICRKYIPKTNPSRLTREGNRTRKKKVPIAPLFMEHADTEQLAYNLDAFKHGDLVEISLKMHETSQRTGYLPVLKGYKKTLLDRIFKREGIPIYDWGLVTGTRRTVLDSFDGGFYGSNEFRKQHEDALAGKLLKGESCYYEVVGFTTNGTPIMGQANNKKLNDKDFVKQYGEVTTFSYGCSPTGDELLYGRDDEGVFAIPANKPQSDMYVYRMTMTNEDGDVIEYTPDYMHYRCEQMGIKCVPVFETFIIPEDVENAGEYVKEKAEKYYAGRDPVGKTHVREGVVCRILNRPKFTAYKHKNFEFKCLAGIVVADAIDEDIASEL